MLAISTWTGRALLAAGFQFILKPFEARNYKNLDDWESGLFDRPSIHEITFHIFLQRLKLIGLKLRISVAHLFLRNLGSHAPGITVALLVVESGPGILVEAHHSEPPNYSSA